MNNREIIISKNAEKDIDKGILFYNNKNYWVGNYFFDSILADIESLQMYAGIHVRTNSFYRMLSNRFPFAIYYEVTEKLITIEAVLDMRQNPIKTQNRLNYK